TPHELNLIRQRADLELLEKQSNEAYRAMRGNDSFDVLEKRARHLPSGMNQEEFNAASDSAIRKLTVASHSDAWFKHIIDGKTAGGGMGGCGAVRDFEGDEEMQRAPIHADTLGPGAEWVFDAGAPPQASAEEPMAISDDFAAQWYADRREPSA